jgi:hypothetical protein
MIRRLHDVLFTPTVDRRVAFSLGFALLLGYFAVTSWNNGVLWLAALDAVAAVFQLFGAVVRIVHLRRPS